MEEKNMVNIRTNNRNMLQLNRRIHRDEINDVRRSVSNRYTAEDVLDIIKKLKTKTTITSRELNQLKNALMNEPHNIELVLGLHGAIRGIVGELTGTNIKKQCAAAGCLCNLSTGDSKASFNICRAAGTYLVAAVDNMAAELAVTCVWTLGNLAASSMKTCDMLISQGALSKVIEIHPNNELQDACLYALKHFVYQLGDKLKVSDLHTIVEAMSKFQLNTESCQVFFILSCHQYFTEILTEDIILFLLKNLIKYMEEYLLCEKAQPSCELGYICRTLANTNEKIFEYILDFVMKKNASGLCKKVLFIENSFVNNSLLWLFGNIYNTCKANEFFTLIAS
ncbi:uncharacterized protein LOC123709491 [Pieris brassicae]|uniref:uncharacterized protein LOC123709491 n=1 Tax=Pieris brassicae TaxID=7116 RepID=UPI001E6621F9|nr:uncharacterized protein LOC123709491 [Pieris brassicae]